MQLALIIVAVICCLLAACYVTGLVFIRLLIRRQDNFPTPETGAKCSSLLEPTGERLWKYNIPYFKPFRELPFETVEIQSADGLTLRAELLRGGESGVTVLFFHGYKSEPACDFAAMYDFYAQLGYNLMYIHLRAHGKSAGKNIGFGALDRYDAVLWSEKAHELFPDSAIFMHGMSMGAATILQSADLGLNDSVCGLIADCGYSDINTVFRNLVGELYHLPATPFVNIFEYVNLLYAGYDFTTASSVKSMKNNGKIPLLYICGTEDRYVPVEMAREIYDACAARKELLLIPGAGHAASYMCAKIDYETRVAAFIDKNRQKREGTA